MTTPVYITEEYAEAIDMAPELDVMAARARRFRSVANILGLSDCFDGQSDESCVGSFRATVIYSMQERSDVQADMVDTSLLAMATDMHLIGMLFYYELNLHDQ